MKKIIEKTIIALFVLQCGCIPFVLGGCGPSKEQLEKEARLTGKFDTATSKPIVVSKSNLTGITVITIDSCEYVYCEVSRGVAIVHKANCKNHEKGHTR